MAWLHARDMGLAVMNLDAGFADLGAVCLHRVHLTSLAEQAAVPPPEVVSLRCRQPGAALAAEVRREARMPLSPYTLLVGKRHLGSGFFLSDDDEAMLPKGAEALSSLAAAEVLRPD